MSKDDPFASIEGGRTIIMPSPGGRAPASQAAEPMPSRVAMDTAAPVLNVGLNPLLAAANPLLNLVPQLRATLSHADPGGLKDALAQQDRKSVV